MQELRPDESSWGPPRKLPKVPLAPSVAQSQSINGPEDDVRPERTADGEAGDARSESGSARAVDEEQHAVSGSMDPIARKSLSVPLPHTGDRRSPTLAGKGSKGRMARLQESAVLSESISAPNPAHSVSKPKKGSFHAKDRFSKLVDTLANARRKTKYKPNDARDAATVDLEDNWSAPISRPRQPPDLMIGIVHRYATSSDSSQAAGLHVDVYVTSQLKRDVEEQVRHCAVRRSAAERSGVLPSHGPHCDCEISRSPSSKFRCSAYGCVYTVGRPFTRIRLGSQQSLRCHQVIQSFVPLAYLMFHPFGRFRVLSPAAVPNPADLPPVRHPRLCGLFACSASDTVPIPRNDPPRRLSSCR